VRLARAHGVRVIKGSIFGPVTAAGTWASALLLDGNVGIGGDPVALLGRVSALLRTGRDPPMCAAVGLPGTPALTPIAVNRSA